MGTGSLCRPFRAIVSLDLLPRAALAAGAAALCPGLLYCCPCRGVSSPNGQSFVQPSFAIASTAALSMISKGRNHWAGNRFSQSAKMLPTIKPTCHDETYLFFQAFT